MVHPKTTIWSTLKKIKTDDKIRIGKPISGTQCVIVDERGNPIAKGCVGELWICGIGVSRGYLNRDDL